GEAGADAQPVAEVVAHVVAAEGQHRHGIAAYDPDLPSGGGGGLGAHGRTQEDAVCPIAALQHEGVELGPSPAEDDGGEGYALRVFPPGRHAGALAGGHGEPRVGVSGLAGAVPLASLPIEEVLGRFLVLALPP